MKSMVKLIITENEGNQRLDRFLRKYLKRAPLSMIYKLIRKDVKVNGKRGHEDTVLQAGDSLVIYIPDDKLAELTAPVEKQKARRSFGIVYEDENVIVVNKPSGLLTHGDSHEKKNTLVNQVCGYLQDKGEYNPSVERTFAPAPANRLDRNTSGLVIFGKTAEALRELTEIIRDKENVRKIYMALVAGRMDGAADIDSRLVKNESTNKVRVAPDGEGQSARTIVTGIRPGDEMSLVEVNLITGRTHQIRVHLSSAGHPVAGDPKYGSDKLNRRIRDKYGVTSQLLHAARLEMGELDGSLAYLAGRVFEAPLPESFGKILEDLD
ncbi:MAG: RluA family pseudouridine synthase [Clostridiales bacterium]|nr:RluA family pseudouridine synthase [Clostridiales bacterium]MDD7015396.1 RluA family pseudouridine synthase [Bacillota bacterium]